LHSKQNQKIKGLFDRAQIIQETNEICSRAQIRLGKSNPPCSNDKKLGDSLIWESILSHLKDYRSDRPCVIFVSNDKSAWGKSSFDPWLQREYKSITNGNVIYSNRLSDIPGLTTAEQERIRKEEEENLKNNAVSDFINSRSFVNAGETAQNLFRYKKLLTEDDYKKIIIGSLSNHEIYQSFFTSVPLKALLSNDNEYVVEQAESLSSELWNLFEKRYLTGLKRQSSENTDEGPRLEGMNTNNIPL